MDKHIKAAVIGYVRQGASVSDIMVMTGLDERTIIAMIEIYSLKN